ncbi:TrkA family potassium uptake protein [Bacteroides caecigallinarum]|uniref:potassium channel family protein n=1 Tax=Bacteroides TaxID=816 RepID=UPI0019575E35|nr:MULTISPECIES: TrkA family potassium uptake protein [Bacteroides]MBM6959392.1 TrkA family potassium uptake protein [Bacteroides caecigallinarum]MCR8894663.1 TrkA family potassium uptake protein [Bacteroides sp. ET336]MDN0059159.1 TrkA family potassium uptake protein [Bacteroides caecigallinarum]
MKYLIIGLGNYGGVLAEELTALGHEVVGVDSEELQAERYKDKVATTYVLDVTDEMALSVLPLNSVDIVIVAIGENFGASVRIVSLLKKHNVKHIYARAVDEVHKAVLDAFSLDRILTPEKDAARLLVQLMELNAEVEHFSVDENNYVFKFSIPSKLIGYKINELSIEEEFKIRIISVIMGKHTSNILGISKVEKVSEVSYPEDYELKQDDGLVCYGQYADFIKFWKSVK